MRGHGWSWSWSWRAPVTISSLPKPPTLNLSQAAKPPLNTLQVLSNTTSLIVSSLLSHLSHSPNSPTFQVPSPPAGATLVLHLPMRSVTLPEMQRLKRQFERVQTAAQASGGRAAGMWKEEEVARKFVSFLEESWDT
jgi:protein KTI12